jgi:hypothetical protein
MDWAPCGKAALVCAFAKAMKPIADGAMRGVQFCTHKKSLAVDRGRNVH